MVLSHQKAKVAFILGAGTQFAKKSQVLDNYSVYESSVSGRIHRHVSIVKV